MPSAIRRNYRAAPRRRTRQDAELTPWVLLHAALLLAGLAILVGAAL